MSPLIPVVLPLIGAAITLVPGLRARAAWVLAFTALVTAACAVAFTCTAVDGTSVCGGMFGVDPTARLFLLVVDVIFASIAAYVLHRMRTTPALADGMPRFCGLSLVFLALANVALVGQHLVAIWIAIEATTLALTPLVMASGSGRARRAAFQYLIFSQVGLGLCLFGFVCLARGMVGDAGSASFLVVDLLQNKNVVSPLWTDVGMALVLMGLCSKLGLAPMYAWLPDAYTEAPAPVTAMLAAGQFNCVLVLLLRVLHVFGPGHEELVRNELLALGLLSMLVSAASIVTARDLKRLLAYASINHAGVIAIGLGCGASATYGVLLYALSNAFIKVILFLTAGRIQVHYHTLDVHKIRSLIRDMPFDGVFLMIGTFALLGFPPFGSFFGELWVLGALVRFDHTMVFAAFCVLIAVTFVATGRAVFPMIWGSTEQRVSTSRHPLLTASPKIAFCIALVVLGVYVPKPVNDLLNLAVAGMGVR